MKKLLVKNIGLLATPEGKSAHRGEEQGKIKFLKDAWVLIEDGIIASVGTGAVPAFEGAEVVDAEGHLVTPGLVDAHTHLIFGGWRQNELGLKLHGASYLDIQNAGGGIQSTTNATRQASEQELAAKASKALDEMMGFGTTTVEAKSGYGLATEHELKALEVIKDLNDHHRMDLVATFMGAHLGPCLFDFGYGPFRWCCLSRNPEDLHKTDMAAAEYIKAHNRRYQDYDNYVWVRDAEKNKLVVGTQCRILYQDAMGRMNLALKFNEMVRNGEIGPVILGRDHHDTGGTDAPFRETSNIKDGSNIMAEMATQCYAGNAARGMSYIALHNGGGTGIGRAINGGFGMVLDGSERVDTILRMSMPWDTMVGVARRSWARNENAMTTVAEYNKMYEGQDHITMPYVADEELCEKAVKEYMH